MSPSEPDYGGYVDADYLAAAAAVLERIKAHSTEQLALFPRARLLDVGCGPGTDTIRFGGIVTSGRVDGVDHDAEMVVEADRRAAEAGLSDRVGHQVADATDLPFERGQFDAVHSDRMLQHLPDGNRAVREMVRVVRPGGRIVLVDTDWATLSIDAGDVDLERRLVAHKAHRLTRTGTAGRQLLRWLRDAGVERISVTPFAVPADFAVARLALQWDSLVRSAVEDGVVSRAEAAAIEAELEANLAGDRSFGSLTLMCAAGVVPA